MKSAKHTAQIMETFVRISGCCKTQDVLSDLFGIVFEANPAAKSARVWFCTGAPSLGYCKSESASGVQEQELSKSSLGLCNDKEQVT